MERKIKFIGVAFVISMCILFTNMNVYAVDETVCDKFEKKMSSKCSKQTVKDYYDITMENVSENVYEISMDSPHIKNNASDAFVVTKIIGGHSYTDFSKLRVTKNHPLKLTVTPDENGLVKIKLRLTDPSTTFGASCLGEIDAMSASDRELADQCNYSGKVTVAFDHKYYGATIRRSVQSNKEIVSWAQSSSSKSDAHSDYSTALKKAEHQEYKKVLTCGTSSNKYLYENGKMTDQNVQLSKDKYLYTNVQYYAKKDQSTTPKDTAVSYNFSSGRKSVSGNVCDKICTEVVKVEYGPPVASVAGACFQYQFKITSYVQCETKLDDSLKPNKDNYNVCTPAPVCENSTLGVLTQGGPTEDFESCIKDCDGGKYTRKCSDKCYKQVYGNSTNDSIKTTNASNAANVLQLAYVSDNDKSSECNDSDGCYYWVGNSIYWKYKNSNQMLGRWYRFWGEDNNTVYDPTTRFSGKYYVISSGSGTGIYKEARCGETCYWNTNRSDRCQKEEYLNPNQAKTDYENHVTQYNKAVRNCVAQASCNESTSTYTIDVKYTTKSGEKNTITFPSKTDKDTVKLNGESTFGNSNSTLTGVNVDSGSCYSKDKPNTVWYQSEWTFNSWINNKHPHLRSYTPQDSKTWTKKEKQFCSPFDMATVNNQWWIWDQVSNNCYGTSKEFKGKVDVPDNIVGHVSNFGYFSDDKNNGWNFDIQCFYAARNEEITTECGKGDPDSSDDYSKTTVGVNNYQFRVVDNAALFPGSSLSPNSTGSHTDIGFNWTSKSTVNGIDPTEVIANIQNKGDSIYNEKAEYEFYLTTQDLNKIKAFTAKSDGKNNKYTEYPGTVKVTSDGKFVYSSPLIKDLGE